MKVGGVDVRWAPRLRPEKLRRLYETDARGILDEDLVDEVAYALYSRCESILTVTESIWGKTQCPGCGIIILSSEWQLQCPGCGWQAAREEYHKSWEHQQLNGTNAIEIFREYVRRLPQAGTPQEKMRLIDTLIHAVHCDVRRGTYGRQVARNLIEGKSQRIAELVDSLAYGDHSTS